MNGLWKPLVEAIKPKKSKPKNGKKHTPTIRDIARSVRGQSPTNGAPTNSVPRLAGLNTLTDSKKKTKLCRQCDKKIPTESTYCSQKCHTDFVKFEKIGKWLAGEIDVSTVLGCSRTIRNYLLEQCNNKCPKCGWGEVHPVTGNVPLEVNHIDGDSKNNRPENLEVLCPNCHSLTPNFRALNKKSSRTHRSLRSQ